MNKIKTTLFIFLMAVVFAFTAGINGCSEETGLKVIASMASVEVGCSIKQSGDLGADKALRDLHKYAETGEIPQSAIDELNKVLAKHMDARPTLPLQISNLAKVLGAEIDPDTKKIIGVVEISPGVIDAIATGYVSGFNACVVK